MKTIAIDLNDVIRSFTSKFEYLYLTFMENKMNFEDNSPKPEYNEETEEWDEVKEIPVENEVTTSTEFDFDVTQHLHKFDGDYSKIFPFENKQEYHEFMYENYAWELYGTAPNMNRLVAAELSLWLNRVSKYNNVKVVIVCPNEYHKAIQGTYFFLSKISQVRNVIFTTSSKETWDCCDVLVTANPLLINTKPWKKKLVKIETPYNKELKSKYSFPMINDFFSIKENGEIIDEPWKKIIGV